MQIKIFKALWGMKSIPTLGEQLRRCAEAGYEGVEIDVSAGVPDDLGDLLARYNLQWVAQLIHDGADDMVRSMEECAPLRPQLFNIHSGRDKYRFAEGCAWFEKVLEAEQRLGIPAGHETHRHRLLYSPYVTRDYLEKFPALRLTADFSHWTCVCEYMLNDLDEIMEFAISRSVHIHCRVGHEEGPQVSDPRAPEFARHQQVFQGWWDRIRAAREKAGAGQLIVVPEYGPPGYMQTLPYTGQPVCSLWDICLWQANQLRTRWGLALPQ